MPLSTSSQMNDSATLSHAPAPEDRRASPTWRHAITAPLSVCTYLTHLLFWYASFNSPPAELENYRWILKTATVFYLIFGLTLIGIQAWMTIRQRKLNRKLNELESQMNSPCKYRAENTVVPEPVSFLYVSGIIMLTPLVWFYRTAT